MPTIEENLKIWNQDFDWRHEAWSSVWGGNAAMWHGLVYPRIWRFLPAPSILEIAPGFGRWTEFLLDHCDTLIGIDIGDKCIDACRQRFADRPGAIFETNDGHSLPMVADSSVDFAFSLDSLVHVEAEALKGYLTELSRVLKPDGVAVLHHSNSGAYAYQRSHLPALVRAGLYKMGCGDRYLGLRARSVSAARFAELCEMTGMRCVGQELINWLGGVLLTDCISVVTRPGSRWDRPNRRVVKNRRITSARRYIVRWGSVYDGTAPLPARRGWRAYWRSSAG